MAHVDLDPQPRLYLSESPEGLQAELRFGYGEHELAYDKRLPATGTQRLPGTLVLARITASRARAGRMAGAGIVLGSSARSSRGSWR